MQLCCCHHCCNCIEGHSCPYLQPAQLLAFLYMLLHLIFIGWPSTQPFLSGCLPCLTRDKTVLPCLLGSPKHLSCRPIALWLMYLPQLSHQQHHKPVSSRAALSLCRFCSACCSATCKLAGTPLHGCRNFLLIVVCRKQCIHCQLLPVHCHSCCLSSVL